MKNEVVVSGGEGGVAAIGTFQDLFGSAHGATIQPFHCPRCILPKSA